MSNRNMKVTDSDNSLQEVKETEVKVAQASTSQLPRERSPRVSSRAKNTDTSSSGLVEKSVLAKAPESNQHRQICQDKSNERVLDKRLDKSEEKLDERSQQPKD